MSKRGWIFYLLSHHGVKNLDRTFHLNVFGEDIYLCARCTGTFFGILIYPFIFPELTPFSMFSFMILFTFPIQIDWTTQTILKRKNNNIIRASTGFLLGLSFRIFFSFLWTGMIFPYLLGGVIYITIIYGIIYLIDRKTNFVEKYVSSKFENTPPPWENPP